MPIPCAAAGVIKLRDGTQPAVFLVVVTAMHGVATLRGRTVYKVDDTQLLPLTIGSGELGSTRQRKLEATVAR